MNNQEKYQDIIKQWQLPEGKSTEEAWQSLSQRLEEGRVVKMPQRQWWRYAAAAAVVIGLATFLLWPAPSETLVVNTAAGEHRTVTLPDGSVAELNAGSSLAWTADRTLQLSGEAFFKVKKGSTFTVETAQGKVEVLGTSFNVLSRASEFEVACETGRVAVTAQGSRVEITPGKSTSLVNGALVLGSFDTPVSTWTSGKFVYQEEPLQNVLAELERQFNVRISSPLVQDRFYTGAFEGDDLNAALAAVCAPMALTFKVVDAQNVLITAE